MKGKWLGTSLDQVMERDLLRSKKKGETLTIKLAKGKE